MILEQLMETINSLQKPCDYDTIGGTGQLELLDLVSHFS